jgi:hypothetical protein
MEYKAPVNMDYQRISSISPQKGGNNAVLPIIFILVLVAGAALAGVQIGKNGAQQDKTEEDLTVKEPEPEKDTQAKGGTEPERSLYAPAEAIQPMPEIMYTVTAPKTAFSAAFDLQYPKDWTLETQPTIKLSKGNAYFEIWQADVPTTPCLFPDDKDKPDAPKNATIYSTYREIPKGQITWRLATVDDPKPWSETLVLCEKKSGDAFYHQNTSLGYVPFKIPQTNKALIDEAVGILQKIGIH